MSGRTHTHAQCPGTCRPDSRESLAMPIGVSHPERIPGMPGLFHRAAEQKEPCLADGAAHCAKSSLGTGTMSSDCHMAARKLASHKANGSRESILPKTAGDEACIPSPTNESPSCRIRPAVLQGLPASPFSIPTTQGSGCS